MTVQTKFSKLENDTPVTEKCEQIILACTIDAAMKGGADKILSARACVSSLRATATDGQATVSGKLNVKAIFLNREGETDSVDYVSDFTKTVACPSAVEGATVTARAEIADVQATAEGDTIKIQTVVGLCPTVIVHREYELLDEAEGAFVKRGESSFTRCLGVTNTDVSVDEQYSVGAVVEKILAFDCAAEVTKVTEDGAGALVEGEADVTVVYVSDGKTVQKNMTLPFVQRIEGEEGAAYDVCAEVRDSKLVIGGSATENVFEVKADITLTATVWKSYTSDLVTDVYCPTKEMKLSRMCLSYDKFCKICRTRERISGSVEAGENGVGVSRIAAALERENSVATVDVKEGTATVEGVLSVTVIYRDDNEDCRSVDVDLPYSCEATLCGEADKVDVEVSACDISAKVKRDSEIEVTATICVTVRNTVSCKVCAIDGVEEGADIAPCDDAVSIYYAKKGETLWDIAKKLSMSPEDIAAQNPSLGEETAAGDKVVVYREIAV